MHDLYVMVDIAHAPIWNGPIEKTPWWFAYILQIEKRIDSLRQTAAYDPDKQPPPRDLWPLAMAESLDDYLESRRKENERRMRERPVLDD